MNRSIDRGENKLGNNVVVTRQHRDGSRHGNNEISSKSRRAAADLPHLRRLSIASSNSDSTEVSTTKNVDNNKIGGQQQQRRPSRQEDFNRLSATYTRRHSSPGSERRAKESPHTSSLQSKGKSGGNEAAGRGRADNNRPSATSYTRRHSSSPGSERRAIEPLPTSSSQSKSGGGNEAAIRRRRKCQPHHRSASINEALSSILKPPKYSPSSSITSEGSDSTASTNANAATANKKPPPRQRFLRRWSAPSIGSEGLLPAGSMHSFFLPPPEKPVNKSHHKRSSSDDDLDKWVADGVDFCSNVEVHLFRS
jgi:hypothetical protein